jgi:ribosomal protein S18 acetylase RimI-like enzyme
MRFTQAKPDQLEEIVPMYEEVKKVMNENALYQWGDDYPNADVLEEDIRQGHMYLLTEGNRILGAVVLDQHFEPEYESIPWHDLSDRFLVIHRLSVNPAFQGRGIAKTLLGEIEWFAKEQGYKSIRLDTQVTNRKAMSLYDSQGYERRKLFYFPDHEIPFMAFEKMLG